MTETQWELLLAALTDPESVFRHIDEQIFIVPTGLRRVITINVTLRDFVIQPEDGLVDDLIILPVLLPRSSERVRLFKVWTDNTGSIRQLSWSETERIRKILMEDFEKDVAIDTTTLSKFLTDFTMVLVAVSPARTQEFIVGAEYEPRYEDRARLGRSRIRSVLGFRPFAFRLEVPSIKLTRDYSLGLFGPPDHYVRYASFVTQVQTTETVETTRRVESVAEGVPPSNASSPGTSPSQNQVQTKLKAGKSKLVPVALPAESPGTNISDPETSQSSTAVMEASNCRDVQETVYALVVFNERTPGSLGQAAVFTLVCVFALLASWVAYAPIVRQTGIDAESVVLLLGVPGTLAIWARPAMQSEYLVDPPLLSRGALSAVGLLCFVAAFTIFLADAAFERCAGPPCGFPVDPFISIYSWELFFTVDPFRFGPITGVGTFGLQPRTIVLASVIISAFLALMLLVRLLASLRRYGSAVRRETPPSLPKTLVDSTAAHTVHVVP